MKSIKESESESGEEDEVIKQNIALNKDLMKNVPI